MAKENTNTKTILLNKDKHDLNEETFDDVELECYQQQFLGSGFGKA